MMKKATLCVRKLSKKLKEVLAPICAVGAAMGLMPTVYAAPSTTTNNLDKIMGEIVKIVLTIFAYIGVILALWGAGSLVMAFKNEDADSKSRAIMSLVVGVCLICLRFLIKPILDLTGITVPT